MTGLAILLATAAVGFAISQWLRLPVIPLLIALGVALGQLGPEVGDTAVSQTLEIGLAFLVFFAGLSLSPAHFKGQSRAVFWVGSVQFIAVSGLGFLAALTLGFATVTALYLGAALATSSTLVVVRQLFRHRGAAGSYRRLVTGVILFQDVSIILVIVLLAHFGAGATATATGSLAFLAVAAVAFFLQRTLPKIAKSRRFHESDDELVLLGSLALLILFAYAADSAGLSFAAGAFWAGFALSGFPLTNIVRSVLDSFNTFFLAVFFAALGAQVQFNDTSIFVPALALSTIVFFVTPPLVAAVAEWKGKISTRSAITSGLLLAQTSEFSVIMAVYGQRLGHIDESVVSMIALVAVITMTLTPFIATPRFAHRLFRFHPLRKRYTAPPDLCDHVIVLGYGASGRYTLKPFIEHGIPILVIDHDPANAERLNARGIHAIAGDGGDLDILERASATKARLVYSALPDPDDAVRVIRHLHGTTPVLARVFEQSDAEKITAAGGTPILSSTATTKNFLEWFDDFSAPTIQP